MTVLARLCILAGVWVFTTPHAQAVDNYGIPTGIYDTSKHKIIEQKHFERSSAEYYNSDIDYLLYDDGTLPSVSDFTVNTPNCKVTSVEWYHGTTKQNAGTAALAGTEYRCRLSFGLSSDAYIFDTRNISGYLNGAQMTKSGVQQTQITMYYTFPKTGGTAAGGTTVGGFSDVLSNAYYADAVSEKRHHAGYGFHAFQSG